MKSQYGGMSLPSSIADLERINGIVDLCIDRALFQYVTPAGKESIFRLSPAAKKFMTSLRKENGEKSFLLLRYPVLSVRLPDTLIKPRGKKWQRGPINLRNSDDPSLEPYLLEHWSNLFWAKALRAELQKNNRGKWLKRYDDIVLLLEACMPVKKKPSNDRNWDITLFTFLMELSAIAQAEASYGYAERARSLIQKLYDIDDPEIKHNPGHVRHNYDRWIWYNMGLAYQHIGLNQKGVIEFNRVISRFFSSREKETNAGDDDCALEFLLNICPSILQRAAINLKLQLGYHALQTLADQKVNNFLKKLCGDEARLFSEAAHELNLRRELLKVEALLQVERTKEAKSRLSAMYSTIFSEKRLSVNSLPRCKPNPRAVQTRLVEQTVSWFLQDDDNIKGGRDELEIILRY